MVIILSKPTTPSCQGIVRVRGLVICGAKHLSPLLTNMIKLIGLNGPSYNLSDDLSYLVALQYEGDNVQRMNANTWDVFN